VPRITDFCSCVYVLGCKLSVVRLWNYCVDDITIGITNNNNNYYYYYYHHYHHHHHHHSPQCIALLFDKVTAVGTLIVADKLPQAFGRLTHCEQTG